MKLTVLGGCGAWPEAAAACSGYLVEHDGFRALLDPGYATLPPLLALLAADGLDVDDLDAVLVTHGHPDHCADLNPLLRARALRVDPPPRPVPPLPVHALGGALDAVLALDRPGMLDGAYRRHEFVAGGAGFEVGPFTVSTVPLPHFVPNAGLRLTAGSSVLAYTGDCGPDPGVVTLARDADLLLAEATHVDEVPADDRGLLSTAVDAARQAAAAGVATLVLTHLWPGTDPAAARATAARSFPGRIEVARPGLELAVGGDRPA